MSENKNNEPSVGIGGISSICIGDHATTNAHHSICLGDGACTDKPYELVIKFTDGTEFRQKLPEGKTVDLRKTVSLIRQMTLLWQEQEAKGTINTGDNPK